MTQQILESSSFNLEDNSLVASNKSAKMIRELFPNDLSLIYEIIEKFKMNPKVIFFNS